MLRLLTGPFGTLAFYAIVILMGVGGFFGWLYMHDHAIEQRAAIQLQLDQTKQIIADQEKYQKALNDLNDILIDTRNTVRDVYQKADESEERIKNAIKSTKDVNDQAPEAVKETLRQLRGTK